jgi:hypothetical protein
MKSGTMFLHTLQWAVRVFGSKVSDPAGTSSPDEALKNTSGKPTLNQARG